ncbi:MAG: hypothetical protein WC980_06140 [Candidatus Brocadiia bacterium]
MKLFIDSEKKQVIQAIKEAENVTSCEFVVAEVTTCDDYNTSRFAWGILFLFIAYIVSYYFTPLDGIWLIVSQFVGFTIGFFVVGDIPILKRLFIPTIKMESEAQRRALYEFSHQGLHNTRLRNGILVMLAVFERRVVILADSAVNAKAKPEYWANIRDRIIVGIKNNAAGSSVAEVIKSMTQDFKADFPYSPDDKNELPDGIVTDK